MNYFVIFNLEGKPIGYVRTKSYSVINNSNTIVKEIDTQMGKEIDELETNLFKRLRLINDSVEVLDDSQLWNEILEEKNQLILQYSDKSGLEWENYLNELQAINNDNSNPLEFVFPIVPDEDLT